jgi:3-keto-disaccharide hydrolase
VTVNGASRIRWHTALLTVLLLSLPGCFDDGGDDPAANQDSAEVVLFDGSSLSGWSHAGPGHFELRDGVLRSHGGLGLLWFSGQSFGDFELRLDWRTSDRTDNSGVFLRFPDPNDDPRVAIDHGYEVQINDDPDRDPQTTGAIYGFRAPSSSASHPPGEWNSYRIRVTGSEYAVWLNDVLVNQFVSTDSHRGPEGYIGLQNHDPESSVDFRAIRVEPIP